MLFQSRLKPSFSHRLMAARGMMRRSLRNHDATSLKAQVRGVLVAVVVGFVALQETAFAESSACNRARAIVDEVKELLRADAPNHQIVLQKLNIAQQLCPALGDAWKLAYCSALAGADEANARIYRDRAVFNGVTAFDCDSTSAFAIARGKPLPKEVRDKYALIVGISKFRDPRLSLRYAAKDATDFRNVLLDAKHGNFAPDHVTLLTDERATRAEILKAMQSLILRVQEDDMVVLYVSSHGSPGKREAGLAGVGYILTYDTTPEDIYVNAIEYQDFANKASLIKASRKVAFLDTCYSGQVSRSGEKALAIGGLGIDEKTAKMFVSGEGTYTITSSRNSEQSWESETIQNSYFTHYIIDALKRTADKPTVKEIFDYVSSRVADAVARDKHAPQHPQMFPLTGIADVRIGVMPRASGQ